MSIHQSIETALASRGFNPQEAALLTLFLSSKYTDGEKWLDTSPKFDDALTQIREIGGVLAEQERRANTEITLSQYNADPGRYGAMVGKGEITVVDDPPVKGGGIVPGANGRSMPREEFDALPLREQAAFCLGEKSL